MKSRRLSVLALSSLGLTVVMGLVSSAGAAMPENLAAKARTSATSEHNNQYLSKFAVDGKIPPAGSKGVDLGAAWCVLKEKSGDQADFSFEWSEPVEAAEIIYFGRTAWFMNEVWKDYEVYLDNAQQPVAKGSFKMIHGPQRVKFAKAKAKKITIKFLNSFGGMNPGAAEMMVLAESPSDNDLAVWTQRATPKVAAVNKPYAAAIQLAQVDTVDGGNLRRLIGELTKIHQTSYRQAAEHLAQLDELEDDTNEQDAAEQLAQLQREVLLFDVDRLLVIKRHEITASHVYTYHYEGQRDGGGLYVLSARDPEADPVELLASPGGQILDCDLSYDAQKVLFSWRRAAGEGYHVWTVNIDGTDLTQLTDGEWHDYNACWLPDGGIAFLSTREPQFAYCWHAPVGIVHRMNADGTRVRKLSSNYLNDFTPYVLDDGRLVYSRWEYVDRPAIPIQSLWTINPDGTGLAGFFGNRVLSPGTFMEVRSIPGTQKVICTMTGHNGPTRGAIGVIDRIRGVNAQQSIVNITPDTPVPAVNQGSGNTGGSKPYSCPQPLDRERFLVSARGPILMRTIDGTCQSTVLAAPGDGMQYFNAQPVRPRSLPPVVAPKLLGEEQEYATIFLQDVYNGLEPHVKRGEVKRIRVVRELHKPLRIDPSKRAFGFQFPVISCGATYAGKQVLGEVSVEPDGSACFRVPSMMPIYFMAIDAEGRAVQRMRSFTHLMPGEVQGCIGCHEHRCHASRPRLGSAYNLPPRDLEPMEWGTEGFDYARTVQPVFDKYCIECHNSIDPPNRIDLTGGRTDFFNVSYDVLAREGQGRTGTQYVNWIPTYNGQEWNILEVEPRTWGSPRSKLAEVLLSNHPDEDGKKRFEIDDASRRRVLAWIDLNVPYYGTSETAYPEARGCRQILPAGLDQVLADVGRRRCAECHRDGKIPRREWTRITEPESNPFLIAPLAFAAGGSEKCGRAIFDDTDDPDYQAILATFAPVVEMLQRKPRMDMPGAEASCEVSRRCQ